MDPRHYLATDDTEFVPTSAVSQDKLDNFHKQAPVRKSKLEREREAAQKKAKEEEEEAAKAYEAFVASFGGDSDDDSNSNPNSRPISSRASGKSFVRAGAGGGGAGEGFYNPLKDRDRATAIPKGPAGFDGVPTGPRGRNGASGSGSTYVGSSSMGSSSMGIPTGPAVVRRDLMGDDEDEPKASSSSTTAGTGGGGGGGKKKRDMDKFLEELKRDQKERELRLSSHARHSGSSITALAAREHAPILTGSYGSEADPLTTNIHVGNLPANVTEDSLGKLFSEWGDVGSVKIMWPRLDSSSLTLSVGGGISRRQLGGFVSFMRRPDAERAAKEIDGLEWGGSVLRTGWGKAVPMPGRAIFESRKESTRRRGRSRSRSRSRSPPSRSRSRSPRPHSHSHSHRNRSRSYSPNNSHSHSHHRRSHSPPPSRTREFPKLEEGTESKFLEAVANKIKKNGRGFEEVIRDKERDNDKFRFFWDEKLPSYHYFKMLLDDRYIPPTPISFSDEGNAEIYSSDSAEDSERERVRKGKLGKLARKRFESMLRGLMSTRERIARAMSFALEHADAATVIVDILVSSLKLDGTPVPRKIARLHLVSDILHNASASLPNAWTYRGIMEERLPEVFDHLGEIYLSFPGRMKAEQFRMQVTKIVDIWERDWIVFEPTVIEDLRRRLSGAGTEVQPGSEMDSNEDGGDNTSSIPMAHSNSNSDNQPPPTRDGDGDGEGLPVPPPAPARGGFKVATFQPAAFDAPVPDADVDVDGEEVVEDVDGEDVNVDGEDLGNVDGEDVDGEDVDGEDVDVDGEDVDGEDIEVDVDGEPVVGVAEEDMVIGGDSDEDIF